MQFRRITSAGTWIPQIDGLRFVAILSVILFHLQGQLQVRTGHPVPVQSRYDLLVRMIGNGDRGVLLFFAISGYILARPFLRQYRLGGRPVAIAAYYLRRVTRLEPPYILSMLLYTAAFMAFGMPLRPMLPHLGASLLYVHNFVFRSESTINFVAWSLEIEIQFYLIAPLLGRIFRIENSFYRRALLLVMMIASGWFSLYANSHRGTIWSWTVFDCLHYFLAGFLVADFVDGTRAPRSSSFSWDIVSLVLWPTIFLLPRNNAALAWLPLPIIPLYIAAFYGRASSRFFRIAFVSLTGGMCYSLYLMHMLVVSVVFKLSRHLVLFNDYLANYLVQVATVGSAIALVGAAYYLLIERPCMDPHWPRKLWQRLRPASKLVVVK